MSDLIEPKVINQLPVAPLPLLGTDLIVVSRNGQNLLQSTLSEVLARANQTGTQTASTISDLTEAVQDIVSAQLVAGANVSLFYNDTTGNVTISSTATGGEGTDSTLPALKITRKAINRLKLGEINKVKIVMVGDYAQLNQTRSYNTLITTPVNRAKVSYPNLLVKELATLTDLTVNNNFYMPCFEGTDPLITQKHDTRNVLTGTWTAGLTSDRSFLARPAVTAVTGSKQIFTPYSIFGSEICDTVDIYFRTRTAYGSVALSIDGGTTTIATRDLGSTSNGTDSAMIKWTVEVPRGANVITLTADCTGGKKVPEVIIHTWDSQTPSIEIMPVSPALDGAGLSVISQISPHLPILDPHMIILAVNVSFASANVTSATVKTTYDSIFDALTPIADVVNLINPATMYAGTEPELQAAWSVLQASHVVSIKESAATKGIPTINMWEQWGNGDWDKYTYDGYYTDSYYYSALGNQDIATALKAVFTEVL